jgi:mono/diheme cytochrome c family protein
MKPNTLACLLTLVLLWCFSTLAWGAEVDQGQRLYLQYCSSCHGKDGRGNGTVTPYLKLKVPDLSLLKKNHKGIYPVSDVMAAIDGSRAVRAHGDRQMPVWGEQFRKEAEKEKYTELTSLLKAKVIAEYLATLQR